ncbi:MAG: DUF424 domain-containing protein [Thermoplasmata archaeon]
MDISYQTYDQGSDVLLAACDEDILGRTLENEEVQLKVKESFYGGKKISTERLKRKLETCTIANLVGKNTVEAAIEKGFGDENDVMDIEGVPHLQVVRL